MVSQLSSIIAHELKQAVIVQYSNYSAGVDQNILSKTGSNDVIYARAYQRFTRGI